MSDMSHSVFSTCDFCDTYRDALPSGFAVLPPVFHNFGNAAPFCGSIVTVQCFEDNTSVRAQLEQPGNARVLVVAGTGSLRTAGTTGRSPRLGRRGGGRLRARRRGTGGLAHRYPCTGNHAHATHEAPARTDRCAGAYTRCASPAWRLALRRCRRDCHFPHAPAPKLITQICRAMHALALWPVLLRAGPRPTPATARC